MNLSEKYDLLNLGNGKGAWSDVEGGGWGRRGVHRRSHDTCCLSCITAWEEWGPEQGLRSKKKRVEKSEIGLTRVARSSPQRRRPISPQAINSNNRHISPPCYLDEWPQESPRALCPLWSCAAHNYCMWKMLYDSVTVHFILQSLCVGTALQ